MTDNAAYALHRMISGWTHLTSHESNFTKRGGMDDVSFWRDQTHMIQLIDQVDRDIDALQRNGDEVKHLRKHMLSLYEFAFTYKTEWTKKTDGPRVTLADPALDMLQSLSLLTDARGLSAPWTQNNSDRLSAVLDALENELLNDDTVDRDSRIYLGALIAELRLALAEVGRYGSALVRRLSQELSGVLVGEVVSLEAKEPGSKVAEFFRKAASALAVIAAKALVTRAIDLGMGVAFPDPAEIESPASEE